MRFSEQIRREIKTCGVPLSHIARMAGVPKGNVWNFVEGNRGVSMDVLDALAAVLGLTVKADKSKLRAIAKAAPKAGRPKTKR